MRVSVFVFLTVSWMQHAYCHIPTETVTLIRTDFPSGDKISFTTERFILTPRDPKVHSVTRVWALKLPIKNPSDVRPNKTVYEANQGYYDLTNLEPASWYVTCFEQEISLADNSDTNFYSYCGTVNTPRKYFNPKTSLISNSSLTSEDENSVSLSLSVGVDFPLEVIVEYAPSPSRVTLLNLWHLAMSPRSVHHKVNSSNPIDVDYLFRRHEDPLKKVCVYSRPIVQDIYLMMRLNRRVQTEYRELCLSIPRLNGWTNGVTPQTTFTHIHILTFITFRFATNFIIM